MSDVSILKRPSESRGQTELDWLQSRHSFSFGDFFDSEYLGFCELRVINEDVIAPGHGFGMHPHHGMEIFTYIISGALQHEDSEGNNRKIKAGEFQYMSAGYGVMHSEMNPSRTEPVHFLQIWIEPENPGGVPIYADLNAKKCLGRKKLVLLASNNGRDGSIAIRQRSNIWLGKLADGAKLNIKPKSGGRNFWLQVIDGDVEIENDQGFLLSGDGAAISSETGFSIKANEASEFLVFEL